MSPLVFPQRTVLRKPSPEDAGAIWHLVQSSKHLDLNSCYCYLLLCRDFAETCVVADHDGGLGGFALAYCPPGSPDLLFVWQIGVAEPLRGRGLGRAMLLELLHRRPCRRVTMLEATVTPSNAASRNLFLSVARQLRAGVEERIAFSADLFPGGAHEAEHAIRIGPIDRSSLKEEGTNGG